MPTLQSNHFMAALSQKANDAVLHIDKGNNDNDHSKNVDDIEQEIGAEAAEGEDGDVHVVSDDKASDFQFKVALREKTFNSWRELRNELEFQTDDSLASDLISSYQDRVLR